MKTALSKASAKLLEVSFLFIFSRFILSKELLQWGIQSMSGIIHYYS